VTTPLRRPIRRLLIANRGEIARRIARSARDAGATVVAVYAPSDASAPHVTDADVAVALRGRTAAETYLDADQLVAAALATGADAVHPGYGFGSERAAFASAVIDAGLTWVGPPPAAIEAMGDKLAAKALMAAAGVPVLATVTVDASGDLPSLPPDMALPVIVKAAAGGGGKGMRIVTATADLSAAVAAAGREAAASFGDPTVFVEPYVRDARHVEIQILADDHGAVIHCFERDCSIQRRHQKVIEEAPSPALDADLRARMGAAAVAAARAVAYRNAGTVEFVLDADGRFWFLEVNTRLQVEHPVTEAVTGLDLVREQLRIATGHPLSVTQDELRIDGHAIEARLYAEDPSAGFLPATGTLTDWAPATEPAVRWDSGVAAGSVVGVEWDPMLAKVIAHAPTRDEAAARLALALRRSRIRGVTTNRDFLVAALGHPAFLAGAATTSFVGRGDVALSRTVDDDELATVAITAALTARTLRRSGAGVLATLPAGWHTGALPDPTVAYTVGDRPVTVTYAARRDGTFDVTVLVAGAPGGDEPAATGDGPAPDGSAPHRPGPVGRVARLHAAAPDGRGWRVDIEVDGTRTPAHVGWAPTGTATSGPAAGPAGADGGTWWVQTERGDVCLVEAPRFPPPQAEEVVGGLVAPMPGRVVEVAVAEGATVARGDLLVIVEAMKMEHRVTAPHAGTVGAVRVGAGDQVRSGDLLVVVDPGG
jgi:propionyl-CoA carboxylase alpha chain